MKKVENITATNIEQVKEEYLLISYNLPDTQGPTSQPFLNLEEISPEEKSPKKIIWGVVIPMEEKQEISKITLPERLTNPEYGSIDREEKLRKLAKNAPGIEEIWEITENCPSLTDIILEERENE